MKKDTTRGAYDKDKVQNFIRTHGILLEHQVQETLRNYFFGTDRECFGGAGSYHYETTDEQNVSCLNEIDVIVDGLIIHNQFRPEMLAVDEYYPHDEEWRETNLDGASLRNVLFVECKGHPSEGFLLARKSSPSDLGDKNPHIITDNFHIQLSQSNVKPARFRYSCPVVSDWMQFVAPSDRGKRFSVKDGMFWKAKEQMNSHIDHSSNYRSKKGFVDSVVGRKTGFRTLPMIVTNAPIILMEIEGDTVELKPVKWSIYDNRFDRKVRGTLLGSYIPTVRYQYLSEYLDAFLYDKNLLSEFPTDDTVDFSDKFQLDIISETMGL